MATQITDRQESSTAGRFAGLEPEQLIRALRIMHTSRRLDDREITLKRQNRIYFQASGAGHEAIQVAAGMTLRSGHDWVYPYYRDRALCLTLGVTPLEMLRQAAGAAEDPASGGRQMPSHWGHRGCNIVSSSSPTGTQFLQAAGCAEASRYQDPASDEITLVTSGEGATSEGEFWEALNICCLKRLPVLFLVEDNGYAISVPVEAQTAGGSISRLVAGFPDLHIAETDGTDFLASYRAMQLATQWCREGRGPALVHAHCIRPYSHSLSDDECVYKTPAERAAEAARDPDIVFPKFLIDEGVMDRRMLQDIAHEVDEEINQATQQAFRDEPPAPGTALRHLYSETIDPASDDFATAPHFNGAPMTMVDLINATLREEMRRNPDILVFGEDVADCSREKNLAEVKGKGGVFKVTHGLQSEFGGRRAFNSPIAEASIVGR
ncbi:MAG TPA: thiamine pyrophosphate-dependent enzyme, partial [Candidatus Solibacter sp.]|nr:thiamine pyrophosphate-dependent enzyme [Candidatus Solibacter sp.]